MKKQIYLLLFCLIIIQSCQKKINPNKFIGTWKGTEISSGYSLLKINDSSFSYQSGGNGNKTFSNGNYKIYGDSIILISTNAIDVNGCFIILPFGQCTFNDLHTTKLNCQPSKNEFYEYFENDVFCYKNDTLTYKSNPNEKCPNSSESKFVKSK